MKNSNHNLLAVLKWETLQIGAIGVFLSLLYLQETRVIDAIKSNNPQRRAILEFLNGLQFPLLPDFFFMLFLPLCLVSIALVVFKKWRWYFLSLIGVLLAAVLSADKIYHAFFTSVITMFSFSAVGQVGDVSSAIFEAIQWIDALFILGFMMFIPFGRFYNQNVSMSLSKSKTTFLIDKLLGVLFFGLAIHCFHIAFYLPQRYVSIDTDRRMHVSETKFEFGSPTQFKPMFETSDIAYATTFGIINFHFTDFVDGIFQKNRGRHFKNAPSIDDIHAFFDRRYTLNQIRSPFFQVAEGRNVFLLHFESLNPAVIGVQIGGDEVTPNLNRMIRNGLYWDHILDQVRIGGSSDAEFSTLTGMLASTYQISAFNSACMPHIPSLPRTLKDQGYKTISLHGYKASFWNRHITHPLLGFQKMYFEESYTYAEKLGLGISDKDFFSQALDLLDTQPTPFFAYLLTLSSHYPYRDIPDSYRHHFSKATTSNDLLTRYLQSIRYVDDALGEFMAKAKRLGFWENSLFVVYGDHRPGSDKEMNDALIAQTGRSLLSSRFSCVPVIIVMPGQDKLISAYKQDYQSVIGGLYDIFPTIMHLLGIETPFGVYGTHLFVGNPQRDPAPFYRYEDSFVFNGIQYVEQGRQIATDAKGILFTDNKDALGLTTAETHQLWRKAQRGIYLSNYIYASNFDIASLQR